MILALLLTRRDEAALRCIKSYGIHSEAAIVQVALRRLIWIWDATPEYAPPRGGDSRRSGRGAEARDAALIKAPAGSER